MRRRAPNRAHLIELHPVTEPSNLPGCLGTGKASADDSDFSAHANSLRHEQFKGVANESLKVFAMDYGIEHSVLQEELAALKSGGKFLADGLFNHARPGKSGQSPGLGDIQIA